MSLNVSAGVEARLLSNAQQVGVSIDAYLEQVLDESEEFASLVHRLESQHPPTSRDDIQTKVSRGLEQLERGECADGEEFMAGLLTRIDQTARQRG